MNSYESPQFVEISVNAEIGNYQDEFDRPADDGPLFADDSESTETGLRR